ATRALARADHLTLRERYYIEGVYYSGGNETLDKAINAYKKAVDLYPDHSSARHNLALIYMRLERYDEAAREYEEVLRRGIMFPESYADLATAYASMGEAAKGERILRDYTQRNPDVAAAWKDFGILLATIHNVEGAMQALDKAAALSPSDLRVQNERRGVFVVRDNWTDAEAIDRKL